MTITTDEAIKMAREVGCNQCLEGHSVDKQELTAFANAIERNVVNGLCEVEKDNEFLVAAIDSAIKDRDYYIAKLQEAERDAARYRWLRDVMNDEIWVVNCTDEHLDAAIDAAMEQTK